MRMASSFTHFTFKFLTPENCDNIYIYFDILNVLFFPRSPSDFYSSLASRTQSKLSCFIVFFFFFSLFLFGARLARCHDIKQTQTKRTELNLADAVESFSSSQRRRVNGIQTHTHAGRVKAIFWRIHCAFFNFAFYYKLPFI